MGPVNRRLFVGDGVGLYVRLFDSGGHAVSTAAGRFYDRLRGCFSRVRYQQNEGVIMENVVKLKGFNETRQAVESFKHDGQEPWTFCVKVDQATQDEYSAAYQRLKPSELRAYQDGDLNLFVVTLEAWVDGVQLGVHVSDPTWVEGLTVTGGKVRGEQCKALHSSWFCVLKRLAIQNAIAMLCDVLGALHMGQARAEVERRAGLR